MHSALPDPPRLEQLEQVAATIRSEIVRVLTAIGHDHRGHPGASLSIVEIVTALYFHLMKIDPADPAWPDRDRLVLSKGHGCLAVYAALAERGFFDRSHLDTFRSIDSILQGHPDMRRTPGIDLSSGSLGNGLAGAVGIALAARQSGGRRYSVFVICGDGELQEGVVWEAAMAAGKYGLDNLLVFVDCNGLQACGRVADIMPLEPLGDKWRAFGWDVLEIDGHDLGAIVHAAEVSRRKLSRHPTVVLARTVKGKGVRYMEGDNRWHQRCPATGIFPGDARASAIAAPLRVEGMREVYGRTLVALGRERDDIVAVCADTAGSMGVAAFARAFPERCFEVGIAEQNLMMISAGLAASGRTVFAHTYSAFASMRSCEQLRSLVAAPNLDVKVVAGLGGLSGGIEGNTHLALEDIGILRCIPGLVILNPADAVEARMAVRAAAALRGPVYIRLGRDPSPVLFGERHPFAIGQGVVLIEEGWDVALLTTGLITAEVIEAARLLGREGLGCTAIEFATIKPLDRDLVVTAARKARSLFTIEEHNVVGGLGSAVAEVLADDCPARLRRIGIPDRFLESGTPEQLRRKYGLHAEALAVRVLREVAAVPAAPLSRPHHG